MKLKNIAALCKNRKVAFILTDRFQNQYIGNGDAFYLMPAELELNAENILIIFDIPQEKRSEWKVASTIPPECLPTEDVVDTEQQAEIIPIDLCLYDDTYRLLRDDTGIEIFNIKYLAPLTDIQEPISYFIRRINARDAVIAVKKGLMLQALISAENNSVFDSNLLDTLTEINNAVADWITRQNIEVDPETGEVEEL